MAVELEEALALRAKERGPAALYTPLVAKGNGWTVQDVICTSGPKDPVVEERLVRSHILLIIAGSFECRTEFGRELMTPGSLLLGNAGQCFECGHQHAAGERSIAFGYSAGLLEELAADAGVRKPVFQRMHLPAVDEAAPLVAQACTRLIAPTPFDATQAWQELSFQLAGQALRMAAGSVPKRADAPAGAVARVTRVVRKIDSHIRLTLTLEDLAREAKLSVYHFLRTFQRLTGLTPHQYVRRARLRAAAACLASGKSRVLDIALDCGFGDVTNFNRVFRAEFGMAPLAYRKQFAPSCGLTSHNSY